MGSRMDRRERKRQEKKARREERRRALKVQRAEAASRPQIHVNPPPDLRGLSTEDWHAFEMLDPRRIFERAYAMFPNDPDLKHFARPGHDMRHLRAAQIARMSLRLRLAAITLHSDPPWRIPSVEAERRPNGAVIFNCPLRGAQVESVPDLGRIGHWQLHLADVDGADVEVWFTSHAIDRLTDRLGLDGPIMIRASASSWMQILRPPQAGSPLGFERAIVAEDGDRLLRLELAAEGERRALGKFPLQRAGARVIAKTFLEPWMRTGKVFTSPTRRAQEQAEFSQHVLSWAGRLIMQQARSFCGGRVHKVFADWLADSFAVIDTGGAAWASFLERGYELWGACRLAEAARALEAGFALLDAEPGRGAAPAAAGVAPGSDVHRPLRRSLAAHRILAACAYVRGSLGADAAEVAAAAAAGGAGPGAAVPPAEPDAARAACRDRAFFHLHRAAQIEADAMRKDLGHPELQPLCSDPRWEGVVRQALGLAAEPGPAARS